MSTEIQQNRYDQLVRRVGSLLGPGSKVSEVISELFPMIDVETDRGELQVLSGMRLGFGGVDVAAVAVNISRAQLLNPVDSGMLMTLTRVDFAASADTTFRYGINQISLANNPNDAVFRDTRLGITNRTVGQVRNQNDNPSLAPGIGRADALARTMLTLQDPNGIAVLDPGHGWQLSPTTANVQLTCTFFWRERPGELSELNL